MEQAREAENVSAEASGYERTHGQRNADALAALAQSFLASRPSARDGGDSHLVMVHVDAEVVSLCRRHHRAVHEGGYAIEPTGDPTRPWAFHRPDGTALSPAPPASPPTTHDAVKRRNGTLGLDIGPATALPGWYGERLDLGLALDALFSRESRPSGLRRSTRSAEA